MKIQLIKVVGLLALLPSIASAHPGHGHDNPLSPGHYVFNPEHSIPILLIISAIVLAIIWQRKRSHNNK